MIRYLLCCPVVDKINVLHTLAVRWLIPEENSRQVVDAGRYFD